MLCDVVVLKPTCVKHGEDENSGLDEAMNVENMISPFGHVAKVGSAAPSARRTRANRAA